MFSSSLLAIMIEGQYLSVLRRNSLSSAVEQHESEPLTKIANTGLDHECRARHKLICCRQIESQFKYRNINE